MKYIKCPRCELNWIDDEEEFCSVCIEELSNIKSKIPTQNELRATLVKIEDIVGKTYQYDTHADFLNKVFGTNYEKWMKGAWRYSENIEVWMVRFYGEVDGWKNRYCDNKITEKYVGNKFVEMPAELYKIAVAVDDRGYHRTYTVLGLFKISQEESTTYSRIYYKVEN